MSLQSPSNFLDKSTILALISVFVLWFFWGQYMDKKYSSQKQIPIIKTQKENLIPLKKETQKKNPIEKKSNKEISFENNQWKLIFVSKGMGIKSVKLKKFTDRKKNQVQFNSRKEDFLFEIKIDDQDVFFDLQKESNGVIIGKAQLDKYEIESQIKINKYYLDHEITLKNKTPHSLSINTLSVPKKGATGFIQSFISGREPGLSLFTLGSDKEIQRVIYIPEEKETLNIKNIEVLGFGARYFGQAFSNHADIFPSLVFQGNDEIWKAEMKYRFPQIGSISSIKYKTFFGPKSIGILESVNPQLNLWVDYGFFHYISKFVLFFLKLAHALTGNWGVSVILLTLLIRFVLFPLNLYSYKSMRIMRKIQPGIKAIREKYKKDVRKMNEEVLLYMKKHNAKPFAGIFPLFLQFPIFFALYRALSESFELYQSPFIFWIKDLSVKDPFFILPILMGGSMYVQQKITPMNVEPAQEKILRFLPVIFTFFMVNLPSGLTLYIFISTLFGLIQQYFLLKNDDEKSGEKTIKIKEKKN